MVPDPVPVVAVDTLLAWMRPAQVCVCPLALQPQNQGPTPVTADGVPVKQRLPVGMLVNVCPAAAPHAALLAAGTPPAMKMPTGDNEEPDVLESRASTCQ